MDVMSTTITEITGGITARYVGAARLAAVMAETGDRLLAWAGTGARLCASPDLLASALLSPGTAAAAEGEVLAATTSLVPCAAEAEVSATAVRQAIALLQAADETADLAMTGARYGAGYAAGQLVPSPAVLIGGAVIGSLLPASWWEAADGGLAHQVEAHPDLAQGAIGLLPGLVDGALDAPPGTHLTMPSLAGWAAGLHDEDGTATTTPTDLQVASSQAVPASLGDLIAHLGQVNELPDGDIEVQTITLADGTRQHVVYLPGTDDMNPLSHDGQIRDMQGNLELMAGLPTAYGAGIVEALHQTGVAPDEPVLVVGHSQGGMQAIALAAQQTPYSFTQVVTAGSPVGGVDLPAGVGAVSLEHDGDVIPLTDAADNPDAPNHVTIGFDSGSTGLAGNHGLDHYVAGAAAADASDDPAITAALAGLAPFFQSGEVSSTVYAIARP